MWKIRCLDSERERKGCFSARVNTRFRKFTGLDVDGDIDTCRQIELLEFIHGRGGRFNDINESFMGTDFELFHGLFIDVNGTIDGELLNAGGHWNGAGNAGSGAFGGLNDVQCGLVNDAIIKAFKADTYFFGALMVVIVCLCEFYWD